MLYPPLKVSSWTYHMLAAWAASHGRYPLCWALYGHLEGAGWDFLNPWEQLAVFPEKGTLAGVGHPNRRHEPFAIVRCLPTWRTERHPNHMEEVSGRFWWGLAWRRSWDKPAMVLLDPDRLGTRPRWRMARFDRRAQRRKILPMPQAMLEKRAELVARQTAIEDGRTRPAALLEDQDGRSS